MSTGVVMNSKAIKKVTDEVCFLSFLCIAIDNIKHPTWPKEKDITSPAMATSAASANAGQGMVAVVVRKHVVHIVDDAADTADKDVDNSTKTSTVPKPRPPFKIMPVQQSTATVPQAIQTSTTSTAVASNSGLWPEYACLVLGSTGGIGIRLQTPELAIIIRSAIHKIISWILFKDSYPSLLTRALWNRAALAEASKEFMDCAQGPLKERYQVIQH